MTNRKLEQIEVFLEMCVVYIEQCETAGAIEALGFEIAEVKKQVGAVDRDLDAVKRRYLSKRKELA